MQMKPKHPKRLYFRKVKHKKPGLTWGQIKLHIGNRVHDVAGCIRLQCSEAFRMLGVSMQRAAVGIHATARLLAVDLQHHAALLHWPELSYRGRLQLRADEVLGLRKLASE
jgi:hypothetical protein